MASLPVSESQDNFRATKRKLDDAFLELDNSVITQGLTDEPHPPKRSNTSRSFYSTLAKYGISTKHNTPVSRAASLALTKPTPHLSAILSRASTRTRSLFSFRSDKRASSDSAFSSNVEYRPSSVASFLSRLSTFKLATYANKPEQIDAVAASRCGWTNDGKDRLACGICGASWVVAGREGMSREAGSALVEKQRISLVEAHKYGCPWRSRQCDPSIYRIPLQSPAATVRGIKAVAISLDEFVKVVSIKYPLSQAQANSVKSVVSSYNIPADSEEAVGQQLTADPPSETAILMALFGWSLVQPTAEQKSRRPTPSRDTTPAPGTPVHSPSIFPSFTPSRSTPIKFNIPTHLLSKRDALLQCALCQRRLGLWTFLAQTSTITNSTMETSPDSSIPSTPRKTVQQRQFDLLREHRSYCPYVVRSTSIPTLPVPPVAGSINSGQFNIPQASKGIMEGWRAVLTVVLRYGLGQKRTPEHDIFPTEGEASKDSAEAMEVDDVRAMVAGVKSQGGKELLKYVKGLLG